MKPYLLSEERLRMLEKEVSEIYPWVTKKRSHGTDLFYKCLSHIDGPKWLRSLPEEYDFYHFKNMRKTAYRQELSDIKKHTKIIEAYFKFLNKHIEKIYKDISACPHQIPEVNNFRPEDLIFATARGDFVRSKSEVFIADVLFRLHIPYKYEPEMFGGLVHPDFVIEDNILGKTVIWEHFGMLGDPTYAQNAWKKIELYRKNGFELGDNLIITYEYTDENKNTVISFSSYDAERIARKYFIPESFIA